MNAGMFASTASNPLGVKGANEIVELYCALYSLYYLWARATKAGSIPRLDLIVFGLIWAAFLYSGFAAQIRFGQPFYYGLIEERRILNFLVYFPVVRAIQRDIISVEQVFSWIVGIALLCGVLSVVVVSGVIPPIKDIDVSVNALREDRFGIGSAYMALATLILLFRMVYFKQRSLTAYLVFLVLVLLAVVQTRQILIAILISSLFILGTTRFAIWSFIMIGAVAILAVSTDWMWNLIVKYEALFMQLGSDDYLEASARALTVKDIIDEILNGAWLGSGALSAMWKGGFSNVYGEYFYLADVGFLGSIYKFGIWALVFYAVYLYIQYSVLKRARGHQYFRLVAGIWIYILIILPVAATLEYRGSISGLLLALSVGSAIELKRLRQLR